MQYRPMPTLVSFVSVLSAVLFAAQVGALDVCPEGTVAEPVSNWGRIRPALAEDVNASSDVVEINLTARERFIDYGTTVRP